jgi:hypothetical protein
MLDVDKEEMMEVFHCEEKVRRNQRVESASSSPGERKPYLSFGVSVILGLESGKNREERPHDDPDEDDEDDVRVRIETDPTEEDDEDDEVEEKMRRSSFDDEKHSFFRNPAESAAKHFTQQSYIHSALLKVDQVSPTPPAPSPANSSSLAGSDPHHPASSKSLHPYLQSYFHPLLHCTNNKLTYTCKYSVPDAMISSSNEPACPLIFANQLLAELYQHRQRPFVQ